MPIGPRCEEFPTFDDCVKSLMEGGQDEEAAKNICGAWQRDCESKQTKENRMTVVAEEASPELFESQSEILDVVRQYNPALIKRGNYVGLSGTDAVVQNVSEGQMSAKFVIVTRQQEANLHNNKVQIKPNKQGRGLILDLHSRTPNVLFEHGESHIGHLPIGISEKNGKYTVRLSAKQATAEVVFSQILPDAVLIFAMVAENMLRMASIGFVPMKARSLQIGSEEELGEGIEKLWPPEFGVDFVESLLLEWSITSLGADSGAFKQVLSRGHINGEKLTPTFKPVCQQLAGPKEVIGRGFGNKNRNDNDSDLSDEDESDVPEIETQAITNKVNQHFDPDMEYLEASKLEYEWVSRYVGCQVKQLHNMTTRVPELYMGSFLTGLRIALQKFQEEDVRNLIGSNECPPYYEAIQLNSTQAGDFLIDGLQFLREKKTQKPDRIVVKYQRKFFGMEIAVYTPREKKSLALEIIGDAWDWCWENNFLKNEAFSLSGRFLSRGDEKFDGVFLKEENKKPLQKLIQTLNEKQGSARNKGAILAGPPGTGKTLSGRVMMNTANATFIWISARDLMGFGASYGLQFGFDLARTLAPSILFVEDIDNFMHDRAIDLLKTEMDGISKSSGVATILTTNYPERLPQALIDRPGRFDDILKFDLPDENLRRQMILHWVGGVITNSSGKVMNEVIEKTEGYSGAHLRELCYLAVDEAEETETPVEKCMLKSLDKLEKQRELIDKIQANGGEYDRRYRSQSFLPGDRSNEQDFSEDLKQSIKHLEEEELEQEQTPDPSLIVKALSERIATRKETKPTEEEVAKQLVDRLSGVISKGFEQVESSACKCIERSVSTSCGKVGN